MKRKIIITFLCLTMGLSIVACGNKASTTPSTEKATATESVTENTAVTKYAASSTTTASTTTSKKDDSSKDDSSKSDTPTSESWPDYEKTYDYMVEHTSESMAHMLNPDIYGTETAGKATTDFHYDLSPDTAEYVKKLDLTTTKGYKIWAYWYVEPNTIQYVYTGEVSPGGGWMTDEPSAETLDRAFNLEKSLLDITHAEKVKLLGEPSMSDEEVIAAIKVKYGM